MSANYDDLLDEPDERLCPDHQRVIPCRICLAQALEWELEARREERSGLRR